MSPKDKKSFGQEGKMKTYREPKSEMNLVSGREIDKTYTAEYGDQKYYPLSLFVLIFSKSAAQRQKMQKAEVMLTVQPSTSTEKAQF